MIVAQADRCKKIVAGLLHFARQNKVASPGDPDVHELVLQGIRSVPMPIADRVADGVDDRRPGGRARPRPDVQVLTNLISNAVDGHAATAASSRVAHRGDGGRLASR